MTNQYTEDSIQKLDPLEFTRLRPDTYCGSTEDSTQLIKELITNCIDEHLIGNCNEVFITFKHNNIITVRDTGQGIIPNVVKENNKTILEMVYGDINTSGKYDKSEDAVYKVSTGAFGIGASLSNFLSHWLTATTKRNGEFETVYFIEGKFDHREKGRCSLEEHGVEVSLQPSEEFFKDAKPNKAELKKMLEYISCICPSLTFHLDNEIISHPNGIVDLIIQDKDVNLLNNVFIIDEIDNRQELNLGFAYLPQSTCSITAFCNYGLIEAGTPITTIKSTITRTLNKWAKEQGVLKEKDKNLEGTALQEGLKLVFNLISPNIRYDSQTKVRVTSTEDNQFISSILSSQLEIWLDNNPSDGKIIIEKALIARKAAEAAKKARAAVKANKTKKSSDKVKILHPDKLKDAEYLGEDSTLLLVEGLSAGASMAVARDRQKYGILMLRGKLINAFSNSKEKLEKNEEIQLLLKALNITPGAYDPSDLRYGRVAICTDSDSDGYHIGLLIATALQHFCPEFIEEQRLCWLRSPLYIVKTKQGEQYYFTDEEMDAVRGKITGEVQRNKG